MPALYKHTQTIACHLLIIISTRHRCPGMLEGTLDRLDICIMLICSPDLGPRSIILSHIAIMPLVFDYLKSRGYWPRPVAPFCSFKKNSIAMNKDRGYIASREYNEHVAVDATPPQNSTGSISAVFGAATTDSHPNGSHPSNSHRNT